MTIRNNENNNIYEIEYNHLQKIYKNKEKFNKTKKVFYDHPDSKKYGLYAKIYLERDKSLALLNLQKEDSMVKIYCAIVLNLDFEDIR
jgi:hypothetical protein